LLVVFGVTFSAFAQAPGSSQEIPEEAQKRLDHIIGRWHFKTDILSSKGDVRRTVEGTEEATFIIDRRVVELTTSVPAQNSVSKGWLFYNVAEEKFYFTSVDDKGDHRVFTSGLEKYQITSQPKLQGNGRELIVRFTHQNIEDDSFEAIIDGGESWWIRSKQYLSRE
jgi:hypothetical protein